MSIYTNELSALASLWHKDSHAISSLPERTDIKFFEEKSGLCIPASMQEYFLKLNGTNDDYDQNFFRFYSLNEFKNLDFIFADWTGIPNYQSLLSIFPTKSRCFVFCDYQLFTCAFGIVLGDNSDNDIYCFSGNSYEIVAKGFDEFIKIYLDDFNKLLL